jgi:hypothetical protein
MTARVTISVLLPLLVAGGVTPALGQYAGVASTRHNLSATGSGEVRAMSETQICKFCHIPHNALVPEALWSRRLPEVQYDVPPVRDSSGARVVRHQPDGSSRLCLSCHDGTIALGEIGGEPRPIAMIGATRLEEGRPGFLGTDLTGAHPISFVVPDGDRGLDDTERDMGIRPLSSIRAAGGVRLDAAGKMQCTTCHDPHIDRYYQEGRVPHFWVKPTVEEVCLACHELR